MVSLKVPEDLIALMSDAQRTSNLTDDDWIYIGDWIKENVTKDKVSPEIYNKFWPLGIGEVIGMIYDGIHYKRKTGRYAEKNIEISE